MISSISRKSSLSKLAPIGFLGVAARMQSRRGPPGGFGGQPPRQPPSQGYNEFQDPRDPRFAAMNRAQSHGDQFGRPMGQQPPRGMPNEPPRGAPAEEPQERPPIVKPGPPKHLIVENLPESFQTSEKASKAYDGVVRIKLNRASKNLLNSEYLKELVSWVHYLGNEEGVKAIILSSATSTAESPVFSMGLDMNELIHPVKERFEAFWNLVQEAWMLLTSFPKVLIAEINGSATSAGCMLAMACDHRIMLSGDKCKIGFDDVLKGLVVPPWIIAHFAYLVGNRQSEKILQAGKLLSAEEAQKIGLVDEVVSSMDEAKEAADKAVRNLLKAPDQGRWMVKDMSRRELFRFLSEEDDRRYDIEFFSKFVQHPDVQKNLQQQKSE